MIPRTLGGSLPGGFYSSFFMFVGVIREAVAIARNGVNSESLFTLPGTCFWSFDHSVRKDEYRPYKCRVAGVVRIEFNTM